MNIIHDIVACDVDPDDRVDLVIVAILDVLDVDETVMTSV